jgi:hypothetical protein
MDESMNEEMKELVKGFAEDLGYSRSGKGGFWTAVSSFDFKSHKRPLQVGVIVILILAFFFGVFLRDNSGEYMENQVPIQASSEQVEKKLRQLQGLEEKIARLEREDIEIRQALKKVKNSKRVLESELERMGKRLPSPGASGGAPSRTQKTALKGGKCYHVVRAGDSLYKIAQHYALTVQELCQLNHMTQNKVIRPGQRLLISPGKNRKQKAKVF